MSHRDAPLTVEGRLRLIERCRTRPIAHVAAEMGISRACASKWVNRWRRHGDLGLLDRPSPPPQPTCDTGVGDREDRVLAGAGEVVRAADHSRAGLHGQRPHSHAALDQTGTGAPPVTRSLR
ncbi:helix-turn-helix domain-containing protein [Streptomyces sp. ISL-99]|nr:helix-turn-helix domain-containing protein [Streptomyces sp. ISL-99]